MNLQSNVVVHGNAMYENHETVIIKLSAEMHINFTDVSHLGPQSLSQIHRVTISHKSDVRPWDQCWKIAIFASFVKRKCMDNI